MTYNEDGSRYDPEALHAASAFVARYRAYAARRSPDADLASRHNGFARATDHATRMLDAAR